MIHIGEFEGIGGFSLAAHWMGWETLVTCEINPFCQRVLKYYWPEAYHHGDIHTLTYETINKNLTEKFGENWRIQDIILTGGFPCQPYSTAGKRLGKEDSRHLWPEMLRTVQEIAPRYIVGENVYGLVNWNGGMVFDEVQADLEAAGYEVIPVILPACAVNAPHRRERIWFVAHNNSIRLQRNKESTKGHEYTTRREAWSESNTYVSFGDASNTEGEQSSCFKREFSEEEQKQLGGICFETNVFDNPERFGQQEQRKSERPLHTKANREWEASWTNNDGRWPTQSPICDGDDGISSKLDGCSFREWREGSVQAGGNAIVPQVALQIFKAIDEHSKTQTK